jgi:hypothetical protein
MLVAVVDSVVAELLPETGSSMAITIRWVIGRRWRRLRGVGGRQSCLKFMFIN